jgi:glycosyltransferase involved in cell wall biosynthesis
MKLSILICTRNGASTIGDAISCVGRQVLVNQDEYEVIVVDNGSTDDSSSRAAAALRTLPCHTTLVQECQEGKLKAILSGLAVSNAPLVSIVDDDNLISEEFVFRTLNMFDSFPELGMVGSVNTLIAADPPAWFSWTAGRFGCSKPWFEGKIRRIDEFRVISPSGVIAGAGSTFRKQPLVAALDGGFVFMNDTFRGRRMAVTGEDTELCVLLQTLGYWFGSDERITLRHQINPNRLNWAYARRLYRSTGAGAVAIDAFIVMSKEIQPSHLRLLRATWWWMCASPHMPGARTLHRQDARDVEKRLGEPAERESLVSGAIPKWGLLTKSNTRSLAVEMRLVGRVALPVTA